jgi:hypothetical protein
MDDFHHLLAGLPLTSGAGAPAMDANDVHIWTDAILKYACIEAPNRECHNYSGKKDILLI